MDDLRLVKVMKALADPKRFRMLQQIAAAGELSCGEVGAKFALSQPAISHHLKILNDAGWLVLRFWEHDDPNQCASAIATAVRKRMDGAAEDGGRRLTFTHGSRTHP